MPARTPLAGLCIAFPAPIIPIFDYAGSANRTIKEGMPFKPALLFAAMLAVQPLGWAGPDAMLQRYLKPGKYEEGIRYYASNTPGSQESIFASGVLQFVRSIEKLGQSLYRHGLNSDPARSFGIPFLRLPVKDNPNPEPITAEQFGAIFEQLDSDLAEVAAKLGKLSDKPFAVEIDLAEISLDFDGDGSADLTLLELYRRYTRTAGEAADGKEERLSVQFDLGDGYWLLGYSHLLSSLCDIALACDGNELFNATAQLFFAKPETAFVRAKPDIPDREGNFVDWIALIHTTRFPIGKPERLTAASDHLRQMIQCSRKSWAAIEGETDNTLEWLPNASQKSVTGAALSNEMIGAWKDFLNEGEAILDGKKLIPHWRFSGADRGLNLRRVFAETKELDVVLWIQGSGVVPFLEQGEVTSAETWSRFQRIFQGNFIGFAIWIN